MESSFNCVEKFGPSYLGSTFIAQPELFSIRVHSFSMCIQSHALLVLRDASSLILHKERMNKQLYHIITILPIFIPNLRLVRSFVPDLPNLKQFEGEMFLQPIH